MYAKKSANLTIRMPDVLLSRLEDFAQLHRMSKSHVLRVLIAGLADEQSGAFIEAGRESGSASR